MTGIGTGWLIFWLGFAAALAVLVTSLVRVPYRPSILGTLIAIAGLMLAFQALRLEMPQLFGAPRTLANLASDGGDAPAKGPSRLTGPLAEVSPGYVPLPPTGGRFAAVHATRLDLSRPGLSLASSLPSESSRNPSWTFLDASSGIRPEYQSFVREYFGEWVPAGRSAGAPAPTTGPSEPEGDPLKGMPLCWKRTQPLPFASGICEPRELRYLAAEPRPEDMATTPDGRAALRYLRRGQSLVLLQGYPMPEQALSREEGCLRAVSQGQLCAGLEVLPGPALSALWMTEDAGASSAIFHEVLAEFGMEHKEGLKRAMRIYNTPPPPMITDPTSAWGTTSIDLCGGVAFGGDTGQSPVSTGAPPTGSTAIDERYYVPRLDDVGQALSSSGGSERELAQGARMLDEHWQCPGLQQLPVPRLEAGLWDRRARSSYRSLITHIEERPFWLTFPESYQARMRKVRRLRAGLDHNGTLWLSPDGELEKAAVTLVSPLPFGDEVFDELRLEAVNDGWRLFRIGTSAFRLTVDASARAPVGIGLSGFARAAAETQITFDKIARVRGLLACALVAFVIATALALLHALALRGDGRSHAWCRTHVMVWALAFVVIWLSYQSALKPGNRDVSVTQVEWPEDPSLLFLRQWPDEWFKDFDRVAPGNRTGSLASLWMRYWREAQAKASHAMPSSLGRLEAVTTAGFWRAARAGNRELRFWDAPEARNYYFRRSPDYQSMISAWEALAQSSGPGLKLEIRHDPDAAQALGDPRSTVAVVPDLSHVSEANLAALDSFVQGGGQLVFLDFFQELGNPAIAPATPVSGGLLSAAKALGMGRTSARSYSRVELDGAAPLEVRARQRILSSKRSELSAAQQRGQWWKSASYGDGRISFLGLAPLDENSTRTVSELLKRMSGERLQTAEVGTGCATTLLLEPFGETPARLQSTAVRLRRAGVQLRWLVSPGDLARMMPTWQTAFRKSGVVFLDDGTPATRIEAAYLWEKLGEKLGKKWHPHATLPVELATLKDLQQGGETLAGPSGLLFHAVILQDPSELGHWRSSCELGAADLRYLPPGALSAREAQWVSEISKQGPRRYGTPLKLAERARKLAVAPDVGGTRRELGFPAEDPAQWKTESKVTHGNE